MRLANPLATAYSAALLAPTWMLLKIEGSAITDQDRREFAYLMLATLAALVTLIIFILGIFIMKRMGARLRSQRVGGQPTTYIDLWSKYRLSDDEIEAATAEDEPSPDQSDRPDDDNDTPDGETR